MKRKIAIAIAGLCAASFLFPQSGARLEGFLAGMNDHAKARAAFQAAVITAQPSRALLFAPRSFQDPKGTSYVFLEKEANAFSVVFSSAPSGGDRKAGDFIVRRGINPAQVKYLRIILQDGGGIYAQLESRTSNDRTYLKLVSGDKTLYSNIVIAAPIYTLYTKSVASIFGLAGGKVDWEGVLAPKESPEGPGPMEGQASPEPSAGAAAPATAATGP